MSRCFFLKPSKTQDFGARCFGDSRGCPLWFGKILWKSYPGDETTFFLRKKDDENDVNLTDESFDSEKWFASWNTCFRPQFKNGQTVGEFGIFFLGGITEICCQKDNSDVVPKGCRESHRTAHWGPMSFFQKLFCHFELHMDLKYCIITL